MPAAPHRRFRPNVRLTTRHLAFILSVLAWLVAPGALVPVQAQSFNLQVVDHFQLGESMPGATPGTLTMDGSGALFATGGATFLGGITFAARVRVSGAPNTVLNPTDPSIATMTSDTAASVSYDPSAVAPGGLVTIPASGTTDVTFAIVVNLAANQTRGLYTGSFAFSLTNMSDPLDTETVIIDVSMRLFAQLAISELQPLQFGTFAPGPTPGVVVVDRLGNRTAAGGVQLLPGEIKARGIFEVSGEPNTNVIMTGPPDNSVTLENGTGGVMTVKRILVRTTPYGTGPTGLINMSTGGEIGVAVGQPSGTYTGTYLITVNYE